MWFLAHRIVKPHSYAGYLAAVLLKGGTWLGYVKRKIESTDDLLLFKDRSAADAMAVQLALTGATADAIIAHSGPIEVLRLENFFR